MIRQLLAAFATVIALNAAAAVDANQANVADLESVKGIGPGLAGKIVSARESGAFKSWADFVDRVGGVGPGSAAKLSQAGLTVAGAPFDAAAMPAAPTRAKKSAPSAKSEAGAVRRAKTAGAKSEK